MVVATGPYQLPVVPALSNSFPIATYQTTANRYSNAQQLPSGAVLVVGSGGSGWQIAEDLLRCHRRVYLSVGRHRRVPRRYRGKDFGWWQECTGAADQVVDGIYRTMPAPLLTGVNGGHDADLRDLARRGVTLLGSLGMVSEGRMRFVGDLRENLAKGDDSFEQFKRSIDDYVVKHDLPMVDPSSDTAQAAVGPSMSSEISELNLRNAGITSVIWAVGYQHDFGWIKGAVRDARNGPVHHRGVSPTPGLYFLGLPRLHKVKSAFLWGVGDDAAYLAGQIQSKR